MRLACIVALTAVAACKSDSPEPADARRSSASTPENDPDPRPSDPNDVLEGIVRIEAAGYNVCALDGEGRVYCWGTLDHASEVGAVRPWRIGGLPKIRDLRVHRDFEAIGIDDRVYYWGWRVAPFYERPTRPDDCKQCDVTYELDPALDAEAEARAHPGEVVALPHTPGLGSSTSDKGCLEPQCRSTRRGFWSRISTRGHFLAGYGLHEPGHGHAYVHFSDRKLTIPATGDLVAIINPDVVRVQHRWCRVFRSGTVRCDIKGLWPFEVDEPSVVFEFGERIVSASSDESARGLFVLESGRVAGVTTELKPYVHPKIRGIVQADGSINWGCGADRDGEVSCWRRRSSPPTILGSAATDPEVWQVEGLRSAKQVAARTSGFCALGSDGRVRCWGANFYGQCGVGYASKNVDTPTLVVGPENMEAG